MKPINLCIAEELGVREQQIAAAISLLDGGATVPFVARYRKESTGALDDAQLRTLEERLRYLRELDERRAVILDSISQQGKLDAALEHAIEAADSKARLEDLYLPYRPKRRTKAQIAREAGLEPLAEALLARPDQSPEQVAGGFVEPSKGVIDSTAALEGARLRLRPILMTSFAFILGCVPLWTASGAGSVARQIMGTAVIGGMLAASALGIFFIPAVFYVVERLSLGKAGRAALVAGTPPPRPSPAGGDD